MSLEIRKHMWSKVQLTCTNRGVRTLFNVFHEFSKCWPTVVLLSTLLLLSSLWMWVPGSLWIPSNSGCSVTPWTGRPRVEDAPSSVAITALPLGSARASISLLCFIQALPSYFTFSSCPSVWYYGFSLPWHGAARPRSCAGVHGSLQGELSAAAHSSQTASSPKDTRWATRYH